jgi:hypothetical protein
MQENYEKFVEVAGTISKVWTKLAKEYGWPHRKSPDDLMREGKAIRTTLRYWALNHTPVETEEAIEWILRRWNWQKSPAPLNLITSKTQWNSYQLVINRLVEEESAAEADKMNSLYQWALLEMQRNIKKGMTAGISIKNIKDLAKILGKTKLLGDKNTEDFYRYCEKLEKDFSENKSLIS